MREFQNDIMASAGYDEKIQELSLQFKSLGEQNDAQKSRAHEQMVLFYFLKQYLKDLLKDTENDILFRPYGSVAEELKCIEPDDVGDVDIVIYPDSNNLTIHEELIEYLPENPMHVRIKGADHPVLKSCLVEDTEYVATSVLKTFHPAIYGPSVPSLVDVIIFVTAGPLMMLRTPEQSSLLQSTYQLKNKEASPALTFSFSRPLNRQPNNSFHVYREGLRKEATNVTDFEKSSDHQEGGVDIVPAFKAPGWPIVAQEWIRRERKWPSQEVIDQILQEGFHLVVKAPKKGGNLECDFRISFANAEFLLSRELNEVQRECYRCLKKFHRAYLSTKPKSLVSFHLKNLFLQTVEETGAEMWTQSNRVECMMKLFRNLLEALRKRDLRHFFVRSYNLFSVDYIEDLNILEPLVEICEKINENPMQFVRKLTQRQNSEQTKKEQNCMPALTTQGQSDVHQDVSCKGTEFKEAINQEKISITSFCYHDLRDIFLSTSKEMTDLAFKDPHCNLQSLHSLEKSIIEDLREIEKYQIIQVSDFPKMFDMCWDTAYFKIVFSQEPNIRICILDGIKSVLEWCKYLLKQEDSGTGKKEAVIKQILDPSFEDSFHLLRHVSIAIIGFQFISLFRRIFRGGKVRLRQGPAQAPKVIQEDIPLD